MTIVAASGPNTTESETDPTERAGYVGLVKGHRSSQTTSDAVPHDRRTGAFPDRVGHAWRPGRVATHGTDRDRADSQPAGPREGLERLTVADAPDQAERRFRPRARRARMTALPPRVRIRMRKPCVLARLRLLGWNVRFTGGAS